MSLFLLAITVLGLAFLVIGIWILATGRLPGGKKAPAAVGATVVIVGLAFALGSLYGQDAMRAPSQARVPRWWLPTRFKLGQPQPHRPPATLRQSNVLKVAEEALAASGVASRRRLGLIASQDVDYLWLTLKARDGENPEEMRHFIAQDIWTINKALYDDSQFGRFDGIHVVVTHREGSSQAAPDLRPLVSEPPVARISTQRAKFRTASRQGVDPVIALEERARVRWYSPLTTMGAEEREDRAATP